VREWLSNIAHGHSILLVFDWQPY